MIKKISIAAVFVFFICSISYAQRAGEGFSGNFTPEDGHTLLFAGQNNNSNDEYVKITKTPPAGFMFYTALSDLSGLEGIADFGAGETSGDYILKKYPGAALQIGLYLVNSLMMLLMEVWMVILSNLGNG